MMMNPQKGILKVTEISSGVRFRSYYTYPFKYIRLDFFVKEPI